MRCGAAFTTVVFTASERQGGAGAGRRKSGGGALDGVDVGVHSYLEAWPEEHIRTIDISVHDRTFPPLELEG